MARANGNPMFVNPLFQVLIDQVVTNREPEARAGACFAQGAIYNFVGGLAVGSQLKNSIGILHSLASDPHPLVHTWALHSIWITIESCGLMYGPYVSSTLTLIAKLYMSESHDLTALQANESNNNNSKVHAAIGKILYALISVIGPELDSSPKLRDVFYILFEQMKIDNDPFVVTEAIKCIQNFIMFAPQMVDVPTTIPYLQKQLQANTSSRTSVVRAAAITCLYQLTQKNPGLVLESSLDNCLEEQLFSLIDIEIDSAVCEEIKDILKSFLRHVSMKMPSRWIDMCKQILFKSAVMNEKNATLNTDQIISDETDDSAEIIQRKGLADQKKSIDILLLPRWRTQVFALECIQYVIDVVLAKNDESDFNLILASKMRKTQNKSDYLVFRLHDLIKLAFNSATASVHFLKLTGFELLRKILQAKAF